MNKQTIIIFYGGKSVEHEISCKSAYFVVKNLDYQKYNGILVSIDKSGIWQLQDTNQVIDDNQKLILINQKAPIINPWEFLLSHKDAVVFPMLHGTFGEDGTLQGFLELLQIAYVGADMCGSCIGMDKVVAKKLAQLDGIDVAPFYYFRYENWYKHKKSILENILSMFDFPMFVKPAKLGSSVGISKVYDTKDLCQSVDKAFEYDDKVLVEKALKVREIECAIMGTYEPAVSEPGEVRVVNSEFYDYDAKYIKQDAAEVIVPADLDASLAQKAKDMSLRVFKALDLYGMARVDLFLEEQSNKFYFNEVNTIPGFTEISQFPKLWMHLGYSPQQIIDILIELGYQRQKRLSVLKRSYK